MRGPAVRVLRQLAFNFGIDVAGHVEDVGPAVVVEIGHARAPLHVPILDAESDQRGHILEQSVSEAAVQRRDVVGEMRLQKIETRHRLLTVANGEAHAGLRAPLIVVRRAAFERDVREGAIAVIAVEDGGR